MATENDYYAVLGVSRTATKEELKTAFRKLARANHPDTHPGDKKAEEQFKAVTEAYQVLDDEELRKGYDLYGGSCIRFGKVVYPGSQQENPDPASNDPNFVKFMEYLKSFNDGYRTESQRAKDAPTLQEIFRKNSSWRTEKVCQFIIEGTWNAKQSALQQLQAAVLEYSLNTEIYLCNKYIKFFCDQLETESAREDVAEKIQEMFHKHPSWKLQDVHKSIIDQTWNSSNAAFQDLQAIITENNPAAELYLCNKYIKFFCDQLETESARASVAPKIQKMFKKYLDWDATKAKESIINYTWNSSHKALQQLQETIIENPDTELYLCNKYLSAFGNPSEDERSRASLAQKIQKIFKKHPEWKSQKKVCELIIDHGWNDDDQNIQQLLAEVVKGNDDAELYLANKYWNNFQNQHASNSLRANIAPKLQALFDKHPGWGNDDIRKTVEAATQYTPQSSTLRSLLKGATRMLDKYNR